MKEKKLLRFKQVLNKVPFSKAHLYSLIRDGKFPKQTKLGRNSFWLESDVDQWIDEVISKSKVAA